MQTMNFVVTLLFCAISCLAFESTTISTSQFVDIRCSQSALEQVYTTWYGTAYAVLPQTAAKKLFNIVGMNVARCIDNPAENGVDLTSREVQLYLDPKTGQKLNTWLNPYTQQSVPVVHVANNPVQNQLPKDGRFPAVQNSDNSVTTYLDVPLLYPNPLARNETLFPYSPYKMYEAGEFFKFFNASTVTFSWTRYSIWFPWMNMGNTNGQLFFSAQGARVTSFDELPQVLKDELNHRIPVFKDAPKCVLDVDNETSWTYFAKTFGAYLKREEFPLPAYKDDRPCKK